MNPPPAIIDNDVILYGDLPNVCVALGAELHLPSMENAQPEIQNEFYQRWENFCGSIPTKYVVQVRSSINADYHRPLEFYRAKPGSTDYDHYVRGENFARYFNAMREDELWNRRVMVYVSQYLVVKGSEKNMQQMLNGAINGLKTFIDNLTPIAKAFGGTVKVMDTKELKLATRNVLGGMPNEELGELEVGEGEDFIEAAYPSATVSEEGGVLYHDGRFHRFLVLRDTPNGSWPCMCAHMTATSHKDVAFTVNIKSQEKEYMLTELENRYEKLANDLGKSPSIGGSSDLAQLEDSIRILKGSSGGINKTTVIAHVWASDRETLNSRTDELRMNFAALRGATLYEPGLPVESRKLFYATLPGYHGDKVEGFELEMDPALTSRMLPLTTVYKGENEAPMCLYEGEGRSLVGLTLFRDRPLHTCIFGSSGVGKSVCCNDILTQMYPYLDRCLIIETGNSYGVTVGILGGKTLDLTVNGSYRLNVFDTHGCPLNSSDIGIMSEIIYSMTGLGGDEGNKVQSVIAQTVEAFMGNSLETFKEDNEELVERGYKEAWLFHQYKSNLTDDFEEVAAYWRFKAELNEQLEAGHDVIAKVSHDEMLDFIQNPNHQKEAERYLYSLMSSENFEILEDFKDFVEHFRPDVKNGDVLDDLATMLEPWCGGKHGNLLNGHTNFNLKGRLVQLELEGLGDNDELKNVVLTLINVIAFQDVLASPRNEKKLFLFEEMGSLSRSMSGLGEIVKTIAQTGRKYNLCLLTIVQQYQSFGDTGSGGLMEAVVGNASQFIIFRQKSRQDITNLLREVNLPQSLADIIMDYPMPQDIRPAEARHSTCLVATENSSGWDIGTMKIHCIPAVIWAADSSGENYESKMKVFREMKREKFMEHLLDGDLDKLKPAKGEYINV